PLLVHFPIALFFFSFLFDIASLFFGGDTLVRAAFYCIAFGIAGALFAAIPGIVDYNDIRRDHPARRIATWHMLLNLVAVALYAVNLGMRYEGLRATRISLLPFVLSLSGVILLAVSGYLGGTM